MLIRFNGSPKPIFRSILNQALVENSFLCNCWFTEMHKQSFIEEESLTNFLFRSYPACLTGLNIPFHVRITTIGQFLLRSNAIPDRSNYRTMQNTTVKRMLMSLLLISQIRCLICADIGYRFICHALLGIASSSTIRKSCSHIRGNVSHYVI